MLTRWCRFKFIYFRQLYDLNYFDRVKWLKFKYYFKFKYDKIIIENITFSRLVKVNIINYNKQCQFVEIFDLKIQ